MTTYINFAPQHHYVVQAAVSGLSSWVRTGEPAPHAARIAMHDSDLARPVLDRNGLATDGIRTPWVDVPIARTSGHGAQDSIMAAIFGSGEPFDAATLDRLYPGGAQQYLDNFSAALDRTIESGFILSADRGAILQLATAIFPGSGSQRPTRR